LIAEKLNAQSQFVPITFAQKIDHLICLFR
jgi:hypothetical protein